MYAQGLGTPVSYSWPAYYSAMAASNGDPLAEILLEQLLAQLATDAMFPNGCRAVWANQRRWNSTHTQQNKKGSTPKVNFPFYVGSGSRI